MDMRERKPGAQPGVKRRETGYYVELRMKMI